MPKANKITQIPYGDTIRKQMKAKVVLQMRKKCCHNMKENGNKSELQKYKFKGKL